MKEDNLLNEQIQELYLAIGAEKILELSVENKELTKLCEESLNAQSRLLEQCKADKDTINNLYAKIEELKRTIDRLTQHTKDQAVEIVNLNIKIETQEQQIELMVNESKTTKQENTPITFTATKEEPVFGEPPFFNIAADEPESEDKDFEQIATDALTKLEKFAYENIELKSKIKSLELEKPDTTIEAACEIVKN